MKKIEFIVLTCDKYLTTRVESIKKTWGQNVNIKFLTDTVNQGNIISYNTPQNYEGIFLKFLYFFKNYDFTKNEYYFFTDDDTFVNLRNLEKLDLPSKDDLFMMGRLLCLNPDGTDLWGNQTGTNVHIITGKDINLPIHYTSGGAGFILSQSSCISIQKYLRTTTNPAKCRFGDVTIGFWCRNSGVKVIPNNNFWWDSHEKLLDNSWEKYNTDVDAITYHYIDENLMVEYHNKYNI